MNIRDMEYIVTIIEERSLTKAAEKLHTTQPNISRAVKKIEENMGISIFNKNKLPWSLTYAGELFLKRIKEITTIYRILQLEMQNIANNFDGCLTIGAMFFEEKFVLSKVIPIFKQLYPKVEVRILQETATNLEKLILDDKVNISILILPINYSGIEYIPIHTYDIFLALPKNHSIAKKLQRQTDCKNKFSKIDPAVLQKTPLIILKEDKPLRKIAQEIIKKCQINPQNIFEANNFETAKDFVANGYGATFVIGSTAIEDQNKDQVVYFKMDNPNLTKNELKQTIAFGYKKNKKFSEQEKYLLKLLQEVKID